jgi:hypothetical protein
MLCFGVSVARQGEFLRACMIPVDRIVTSHFLRSQLSVASSVDRRRTTINQVKVARQSFT